MENSDEPSNNNSQTQEDSEEVTTNTSGTKPKVIFEGECGEGWGI